MQYRSARLDYSSGHKLDLHSIHFLVNDPHRSFTGFTKLTISYYYHLSDLLNMMICTLIQSNICALTADQLMTDLGKRGHLLDEI